MAPCEMAAVRHAVDCCEDDVALKDLMQRIKRDVEAMKGTDSAWTAEQLAESREWCRQHREWLRREHVLLDGVDHFPASVSGFKSLCDKGIQRAKA